MTHFDSTDPAAVRDPLTAAAPGVDIVRGLLWREWLAHRNWIVGFVAAWLVLLWVLLVLFHPGLVMIFGVALAVFAGARIGGTDAAEGVEEFSFSLPPTRSQRYLVRMGLGLVPVFVLTLLGVLAVRYSLPQSLWGLVVESGFTEPFPVERETFVYVLAVVLSLAAFAFTFAIASSASRWGLATGSYLLGLICSGVVVGLGFLAEHLLWRDANGYVVCPALAALGTMALLSGYLYYVRKEGIARPAAATGGRWWIIVIVGVLVLLLLLMFMFVGVRSQAPNDEMDAIIETERAVPTTYPGLQRSPAHVPTETESPSAGQPAEGRE